MQQVKPQTPELVKQIAREIIEKRRIDFRHQTSSLLKVAWSISPTYRDFILKILKNSSLKMRDADDCYILPANVNFKQPKYSKRAENCIYFDPRRTKALSHELGHAVDFWFGNRIAFSTSVPIQDGKTLNEIFTEEFDAIHEQLYKDVMEEYKNIINSNINKDAYNVLITHMDEYRFLDSIPPNLKNKERTKIRQNIQKRLYECNFVEYYYQLFVKKCYAILNQKYAPILDALSSRHDFHGLALIYHESEYYQYKKNADVHEFFANLFSAEVSSDYHHFEPLKKYLPKSFSAFEKLFGLFFERIQNNKRFTDIKLKEVQDV